MDTKLTNVIRIWLKRRKGRENRC